MIFEVGLKMTQRSLETKNLNWMDSRKKMEVKQVNSEYRLFKEFAVK